MKQLFRIDPRKGDLEQIRVFQTHLGYLSAEVSRWKVRFYLTESRPRNYRGARKFEDLIDPRSNLPLIAMAGIARSGRTNVVSLGAEYYFRSKTFNGPRIEALVEYIAANAQKGK